MTSLAKGKKRKQGLEALRFFYRFLTGNNESAIPTTAIATITAIMLGNRCKSAVDDGSGSAGVGGVGLTAN